MHIRNGHKAIYLYLPISIYIYVYAYCKYPHLIFSHSEDECQQQQAAREPRAYGNVEGTRATKLANEDGDKGGPQRLSQVIGQCLQWTTNTGA